MSADTSVSQSAPAEPLTGEAGLEHAAGFKPLKDVEQAEKPEFASEREAADVLAVSRLDQAPHTEVFYEKRATGEKIPDNETVAAERAARDLSAFRAEIDNSAARSISADFAAEVDRSRAEALKANPEKLAEHYGVDPAVVDQVEGNEAQNAATDEAAVVDDITAQAIDAIDGLDPETRKALKIPQVREALEQQFSEADKVRETYSAGLENTRIHALATLAEVVPHLAGLPPQQFQEGLALLSQVDPPAFQTAMNILGRVQTITQAQQQDQHQRSQVQAQEFWTFKASQDAKLAETLGADRGLVQQYQPKVEGYFKSIGLTPAEMRALASDRTANSAAGQRVLLDAMRYREIMGARDTATARTLPPVQRPGSSQSRGRGASETVASLERALSSATTEKQQIRLAAQLTTAKRAARER